MRGDLFVRPGDSQKYSTALQAGEVDAEWRAALAVKGFQTTAHYDKAISAYLSGSQAETLTLYPGHRCATAKIRTSSRFAHLSAR